MPGPAEMQIHDPLLGVDVERLEREMENYQEWMDQRTEEAYNIASQARAKGLDHSLEVEIPRASDLASRTEKLLVQYLEGAKVADDIRQLLSAVSYTHLTLPTKRIV